MAEQYNPDTGQWEQIPGTREQAGAPLNQFVADTGAALVSAIPFYGGLSTKDRDAWYREMNAIPTEAARRANQVTGASSSVATALAAPAMIARMKGSGLGLGGLAAGETAVETGSIPTLVEGVSGLSVPAARVGIPAAESVPGWLSRASDILPSASQISSVVPPLAAAGTSLAGSPSAPSEPTAAPAQAKKAPVDSTTADASSVRNAFLAEYQSAYDKGDFPAAYRAAEAYGKARGIPLAPQEIHEMVKAFYSKNEGSTATTQAAPFAEVAGELSDQEKKEESFFKHALEQVKTHTGIDPYQDISKLALQGIHSAPIQLANGSWVYGNASYQAQYEQNLARIKPAYDGAKTMLADLMARFRTMHPPELGRIIKSDERYVRPGTPGTGIVEGNLVLKPGEQVVPATGGAPVINPNKQASTPLGSAQLEAQLYSLLPKMDTAVRAQLARDPAKLKAYEEDMRSVGLITDKAAATMATITIAKKHAPALTQAIDKAFGNVSDIMLGSQRQAPSAAPSTKTSSRGQVLNLYSDKTKKLYYKIGTDVYDENDKKVDPKTI